MKFTPLVPGKKIRASLRKRNQERRTDTVAKVAVKTKTAAYQAVALLVGGTPTGTPPVVTGGNNASFISNTNPVTTTNITYILKT